MKKMIFTFFIILILPIYVSAYSKHLIPGGESIGIKINTDGLVVVGFYKVDNEYIAKNNIKIGDRIVKINDKEVYSIDELTGIIDDSLTNNSEINIEIVRNNKIINTNLVLKEENKIYKTGLYVKDTVVGIGTLSYIDPVTKIYGALGHEIALSETNSRVEIRDGNILMSKVRSINKSRDGSVGSKNATIDYNEKIGNIYSNTDKGVFGLYTASLPNKDILEIATFEEIKNDNAYILTVTDNNKIQEYDIKIIDKYNNKKNTQKAFSFEIIDNDLLNITGGIVQGMSGSPIIQDNKIIGAVTNVLVDDVKLGYGISIITMLEEGERTQ